MRLLSDSKKKQYEANLCHSTGGRLKQNPAKYGSNLKKNGSSAAAAGDINTHYFQPIDPAPITAKDDKQARFWPLFRQNWHLTISYCLVFWSFGMCVAFLGPTLNDLGCRTETPFATMSWVFFAQALFTLLGSIVGGVLVQRVMDARPMIPGFSCVPCMNGRGNWRTSAHVCMLMSLVMLAVTLILVPECRTLTVLALDLAAMGLFMGIIDTIANLCMIQLYGANVAPFLQALHFFYALGAFASPLINEPFLLTNPSRCFELIDRLMSADSPTNLGGNYTQTEHDLLKVLGTSDIQYGFWIMSILQVPVMLVLVTVLLRSDSGATNGNIVELTERGTVATHHSPGSSQPPTSASTRQVALVTILVIVICFLYDGLQGAFGGYIYSYTNEMVENVASAEAAYLNSCFWGTFAVGRLLSIAVATKLSPVLMIVCNIVGCGLAALIMLAWQHSLVTIYVGTCLFGFSLSSVYPTALSLAESYIDITSLVTSLIVVGAAAGEMVQPVIVGHEFASIGPAMFVVNILLVVAVSVAVLLALILVGATIKRQKGVLGVFSCCFGDTILYGEDQGLVEPGRTQYYSRMAPDMSTDKLAAPTAVMLTQSSEHNSS